MTIYGWDLSHYDNPAASAAVTEGIAFMTHKAGGDANDVELAAWWKTMKPHRGRVLLGAYWVLYPGTPAGRADAFLARLDSQCPGWRAGPFILQVDCERWGGRASTVPGKADISAFCNRLVAKMPKLRPIVYAPKWVYGNSLKGLGYPLWASSYVTGAGDFKRLYPGDTSSRWAVYSGQTPAILQYSSSATIGGQSTSDVNAYRGTLAQLTALVAPGWTSQEDDGMAGISQDDFDERMDKWWNSRMSPAAKDNPARTALRVAPWQQVVGRTDISTHNMLFGEIRKNTAAAAGVDVNEQQIADLVLAGLGGRSLDQIADLLEGIFGDQAPDLGALLVAAKPKPVTEGVDRLDTPTAV